MKATLEGATFNRLIGAVRNFTGKNDARPQNRLIQLHFHKDGTLVEAYALDGYRAAKECAICYTVDEDFSVLVNAPPLKANGSIAVEVEAVDGFAYISYGDIRFRTQQPDSEMFDIGHISPCGNTDEVIVDPSTVGQYTGLTNSNGVKIFEGDIVRVKYDENGEEREDIATVSWSSQEASFSPWNWDYSCDGCDCACEITSIEVIGNIHDNPELIGGEDDG